MANTLETTVKATSSSGLSYRFVTYVHQNKNDNGIHPLTCCTHKHINNFHTNMHNKSIHTLANTLLADPSTIYFTLRATSNTRVTARDHYTSSILIGGLGGAGPSSLHTTLEGPMEYYVKAKWV